MRHFTIRLMPLLFAATLMLSGPALGQADEALKSCLTGVAEEDLAAKVAFQTSLADLVAKAHPEYAGLIEKNRDLQTSLAEAREIRLTYLIDKDPGRFVKASSLTRFTNFQWVGPDEDALAAQNSDYAALMDRIETMTTENEADPDWPALRDAFQALQSSDDFMKIFRDLSDTRAKIEADLQKC